MRYSLAILLGFFPSLFQAAPITRTLEVDGRERSYLLHLPRGHPATDSYPVVLVFHGGGGNAQSMMIMSGMNQKADQEGFLAVYPNGTGRLPRMLTFNGGDCCGFAVQEGVDDLAFVNAILDDLESDYASDPRRVYATGLSNGGIISYFLASKLADRITAIASVAGTMGTDTCDPVRPVPILHIHGTDDQFLPFEGGRGRNGLTNFRSVDYTLEQWTKANRTRKDPIRDELPDLKQDGCRSHSLTYAASGGGAEVVLVRIENGGHTWPGSKASPPMLGTVSRDFDVNDLLWNFFRKHALP